jgi:hypothetical protein
MSEFWEVNAKSLNKEKLYRIDCKRSINLRFYFCQGDAVCMR